MTPIEKLMALNEKKLQDRADKRLVRPPECPPGHPIARFEDLVIGTEIVVWIRDHWALGTVHDIRTRQDGRNMALIKHYQTTATSFIFADTWDRRDRHRVCMLTPADLLEFRRHAMKASGYRGLRQAVKSMNTDRMWPTPMIDGMTRDAIFATYLAIMREEVLPTMIKDGDVPRLTPKQIEVARTMWSAQLAVKVDVTRAEDARREREQVVCDDDRWEP